MKIVASILLAILFSGTARPQAAPTTATACKKSSGTNVFVDLDARPTTFEKNSKQVHIAPALSLDLVSRLESLLNAQGFCVYHNDEFDGAGNTSQGIAQGTASHIEIAVLGRVISFPESREILVYSVHFGDWTTLPKLPYYMLDDKTDIANLSKELAQSVTTLGR